MATNAHALVHLGSEGLGRNPVLAPDDLEVERLNVGTAEAVDVNSAAATVSKSRIHLSKGTVGDTANCDTFSTTDIPAGAICIVTFSETITMKAVTGNLNLEGDFVGLIRSTLVVMYYGGAWNEISRSNNFS